MVAPIAISRPFEEDMKPWLAFLTLLAVNLAFPPLSAQESSEIEKLNKQLQQMQAAFEKQQREMRENFERLLREQQSQIDRLKKQLELAQPSPPSLPPASNVVANQSAELIPAPREPWSPAQPIRWGTSQNYVNVSLDALIAAGASTANDVESLQLGAHDPQQRGFTLQNLEATFDGMVDPYFRGQANLIFQIDPEGESVLEIEEAFLETLGLPGNLQLKAGQFFTEFGRLNTFHPHRWDFVDQPLVNARLLGGDGLRNLGARLSWLVPTPFYSELFLAVQNSQGETAASFRNENDGDPLFGRLTDPGAIRTVGDLLITPRYAVAFDLTDSQTLVAGTSAAFGPNSTGGDTQIYGLDLYWKWKPTQHDKGFPFVSWQSEAMLRHFDAKPFSWDLDGDARVTDGEFDLDGDLLPDLLPGETLRDWGVYSQVLWGIRPRWVAGLRGDFVTSETGEYERLLGSDLNRAERWRLAPNLTWFPSEFSKIRLQYNYDQRNGIGDDHSVWLQLEFLLGAHAAHKF